MSLILTRFIRYRILTENFPWHLGYPRVRCSPCLSEASMKEETRRQPDLNSGRQNMTLILNRLTPTPMSSRQELIAINGHLKIRLKSKFICSGQRRGQVQRVAASAGSGRGRGGGTSKRRPEARSSPSARCSGRRKKPKRFRTEGRRAGGEASCRQHHTTGTKAQIFLPKTLSGGMCQGPTGLYHWSCTLTS